jgi:integrase
MNQIADFQQPPKRRRASAGTKAARVLEKAVRHVANFRPTSSEIGDSETMGGRVASVYGPYQNGDKWRVVLLSADGRRKSKVLDTYEEAERVKASVAASLSDEAKMPIAMAIDEFLAMKRKQSLKSVSVRCWVDRLAHLPQDLSVAELSPAEAQALYDRWTGELAAATHRALLRAVRGFFAWTIERGYVAKNPFASVKPIGKPRRGKPQPRVDEARKLYPELLRLAWAGDSFAACLVVQILLGPRSSEVLGLRVRDVDADGMRLLIAADGGKTANATRTLAIELPELRDLLLHFCRGKAPTDFLFPRTCAAGSTNAMLYKYLHRLCAQLHIPQVCPHSLRGLHATLAVQSGATSRAVASVLGHGSDEITKRHYIAPGADKSSTARNLAALLAPSEPPKAPESPAKSDVLAALLALSPEDRRAILSAVGEKL